MNLLILTSSYPLKNENTGQAAAGVFVRDYASELVKQGHNVTVIAPSNKSSCDIDNNVLVQRFSVPFLPLSNFRLNSPKRLLEVYKTIKAGKKVTFDICKSKKIDHILALWVLPCGYWARQASIKYNIPYSTWALGSDIWSLSKIPLVKQYLGFILKRAVYNFADGFKLAEDVTKLSHSPVHFLPSSRKLLPPKLKQLKAKAPYNLTFLGRWHENKGIDLLLDALLLLTKQDWEKIKSFRIEGGGKLETLVKDKVNVLQSLGCPVVLGGYVDQTEVVNLLQQTDFVVIPSRIESIPVIFSDAMQAQCPVLVTPVGDMHKLIEKYQVGECTEEVSSEHICKSLRELLNKSPNSYQENLMFTAADFSVSHSCDRLISYLR